MTTRCGDDVEVGTPSLDDTLAPHPNPSQSLAHQLGPVVDSLRQLYTDFGLRPYRVFSIVVRWTGGASGRGDAVLESEQELLPTPELASLSVRSEAASSGRKQSGTATLRGVSPRYTEDEVRTMFHRYPLPLDRDGFIEMRVDDRDGLTARRRFVVREVPERDAEAFDWRVMLHSQEADRSAEGQLVEDTEPVAETLMHRMRA